MSDRRIFTDNYSLEMGVFLNVIRFIDALIEHNPDKPELLFASAFLNEQYFDVETAIREYESFVTSAASAKMIDLHRHAEARIKALNSTIGK